MANDFLVQILVLLAGSLLVLSLVRRFDLPPILGYLVVGMLLGPHALGLVPNDATVRLLAACRCSSAAARLPHSRSASACRLERRS